MIVFGLGQQMALFHTVSSGLIAVRPDHFMQFESSLIFMSCLLGLVFCFPLATEVKFQYRHLQRFQLKLKLKLFVLHFFSLVHLLCISLITQLDVDGG
jgi:hypothetical protein